MKFQLRIRSALGQAAADLGFLLALEMHPAYLHDTLDSTLKLVEMTAHSAVGVNLDYVNFTALPKLPSMSETLEQIGEKLYYVHLKNIYVPPSGDRLRVGLSEGQVNHREFLSLIDESGYAGPFCLECPRPGDREWFAQQDLAYARSLLTNRSHDFARDHDNN